MLDSPEYFTAKQEKLADRIDNLYKELWHKSIQSYYLPSIEHIMKNPEDYSLVITRHESTLEFFDWVKDELEEIKEDILNLDLEEDEEI